MTVRAWGVHNTNLWLECTLDSAGSDHKTWVATSDCVQQLKTLDGGPVILPALGGFVHIGSYDAINPINALTDNSVFTKVNTDAYQGKWCVPGLTQNYQTNQYTGYYGEWTSAYSHRMIYALRGSAK